jgi:hypothetical protein
MASIMLVAFVSRALVPPGYMPATDRPFSIEICWEGLPTDILAHVEPSYAESMPMDPMDMQSMDLDPMPADPMDADPTQDAMHRDPVADSTFHHGLQHEPHPHHGSPAHSEHCVFGTACNAGPITDLTLPRDFSSVRQLRIVAFASIAAAIRIVHLPPPRAPPVQLS